MDIVGTLRLWMMKINLQQNGESDYIWFSISETWSVAVACCNKIHCSFSKPQKIKNFTEDKEAHHMNQHEDKTKPSGSAAGDER